ncbi:hypothetical protein G3567_05650 [Psychroflexus sp. YR1-1]|uniref:Lipoprotein n=1 Tax=Psychroflexus aurantiacus TaxID=2709310 RepID=A0A6B3R3F0_9FLAO|nr:hypothetical protein [Psychroflexus aurantiacus]NEV93637.1 hypothetical protein [Psychroflexus aurantiacus]
MMKCQSLLLLCMLLACKSAQTDLPLLQECPNNGDCEVQVLKETKLFISEMPSGILEISFEEDPDFQVVFIQFKNLKQTNYKEEIYLQIPSRFKEIQSKNQSLQNQKVILGKVDDSGTMGFERVKQGQLRLVHMKDYISLHLDINSPWSHVFETVDLKI